jgi:serine/threonine-protein kinase RsbT
MPVIKTETFALSSESDIVQARQLVRKWAVECGFTLVDQTKIVTAASELARNTIKYGGGGTMKLETLNERMRNGLRAIFEDKGPGIPDPDRALQDGYTTGAGLGLGLGGAKRLSNEFELVSKIGEGTRVTITRWK